MTYDHAARGRGSRRLTAAGRFGQAPGARLPNGTASHGVSQQVGDRLVPRCPTRRRRGGPVPD
ncbi:MULTISPECIES: hypothetical protein [unclassified Streptomyces]|uniref:hypothetical protein n=1 Tax=unclassified Streptomyces TaxID=2593676 RepID=UPI00362D81C8